MLKTTKSSINRYQATLLLLLTLGSILLLTACGNPAQAANPGQSAELSENQSRWTRPTHPPVTVIATRTASPSPVSSDTASTALTTWATQTLGLTPTLNDAKGVTTQVLADYILPTEQRGTINAQINASRVAYGAQVAGGGSTVLLLGGGSNLSNENLSVQIKSASLGYLQLPATTFPSSSDTALAQLKQTFPSLSAYNFTELQAPYDHKYGYGFYATSTQIVAGRPPTSVKTAVTTGIVKLDNKIWTFALIGTGSYAISN